MVKVKEDEETKEVVTESGGYMPGPRKDSGTESEESKTKPEKPKY